MFLLDSISLVPSKCTKGEVTPIGKHGLQEHIATLASILLRRVAKRFYAKSVQILNNEITNTWLTFYFSIEAALKYKKLFGNEITTDFSRAA